MAALVAALLIRATDRSAGWVATLSERSGKAGTIAVGALVALLITNGVAATAGWLIGQHMTPNPERLMLALALIAAATGAIWPGKAKDVTATRPFTDTAAHLVSTGLGGRSEFVVFAIAAGGIAPLAGVGGLIGSLAVLGFAAMGGEMVWRTLPHRAVGIVVGLVLAATGCWLAASALRLI